MLVLLFLGSAGLAGCGPGEDLRWTETREESWDPVIWRSQLRSQLLQVERVLPILTEATQAEAPGIYQDTLRAAYEILQAAEHSVPPLPWGSQSPEAELRSKYTSALRELRWSVDLILQDSPAGAHLDQARHAISQGRRYLIEVRHGLDQPASETGALYRDTAVQPDREPSEAQ